MSSCGHCRPAASRKLALPLAVGGAVVGVVGGGRWVAVGGAALAVGAAAAPRRRHAMRIRTAIAMHAKRKIVCTCQLPMHAASQKRWRRAAPRRRGAAAVPWRRGAGTPCEFAEFAVRIMARRANLHCGTVNGLYGYGVGICPSCTFSDT